MSARIILIIKCYICVYGIQIELFHIVATWVKPSGWPKALQYPSPNLTNIRNKTELLNT